MFLLLLLLSTLKFMDINNLKLKQYTKYDLEILLQECSHANHELTQKLESTIKINSVSQEDLPNKIFNFSLESYTKAWNLASKAHQNQKLLGSNLPYITHIGTVVIEAMSAISLSSIDNPNLLILCAILHDVLEDTEVPYKEIRGEFGPEVADGVLALTKNKSLPTKFEQLTDTINRIKQQPKEISMVKLADRISNLQPPPELWSEKKINNYLQDSIFIYENLGDSNEYLSNRLLEKIYYYKSNLHRLLENN